MSNNDDDIKNDFDNDDFDNDEFKDDFEELNRPSATLGDLWRNNPIVKVAVIFAALAFLVGGIILFGGRKKELVVSSIQKNREVNEAPGTSETTETYRQAVEEENTRMVEEAMRENTSAIPMPVEPPKGSLPLQFQEPEEEDPLERWRRMQEERIRQQQIQLQQRPEPIPEPEVDTRTPAINALAAAMSQQMESILGNIAIEGPTIVNVATLSYLEGLEQKEKEKLQAQIEERRALAEVPEDEDVKILLPAGTIEYAELVIEANTDAPGPVLAQIATGPFRGGKLIGKFKETENYLILEFTTIVLNGVDYSADAVALDPDTTLPGVVTDIDRRYFKRIILPAASAFVTGISEAIADSGKTSIFISNADGSTTTTTTNNGSRDDREEAAAGIEEAGESVGAILDDIAQKTKPLLRVKAGTPIGVLFISPVIDSPNVLKEATTPEPTPYQQYPSFPATINFAPPTAGTGTQTQ